MTPSAETTEPSQLRVLMLGAAQAAQGGVSAVERLIVNHRPSDVEIVHVPTMVDGSILKKAGIFGAALLTARRIAARDRPQLAYLHVAVKGSVFRKCCVSAFALPRELPYVLHTHGGDFNQWYAAQSGLARRVISRLFHRANHVIALSASWATYYRDTFGIEPGGLTVLPNPVLCPATTIDRAGRTQITFIFLGSMDERKGAFRAFRAFRRLPPQLRERARLVIAGNGRVNEMRAEVLAAGLDDRVTVCDWLSPVERDSALSGADVYVLPSLNEGLPMGMLEAMSQGLAVITAPVGGIPEVIRDGTNGVLVPPLDEEALADAMANMIQDSAKRTTLSEAALATAQLFDIHGYWLRLRPVLQAAALMDPQNRGG